MNHFKLGIILVIAVFALTAAGCCCGGTDTETKVVEKQPISTAPLGEELIKLKEAYEKGAMSEKEYEEAKKNLLNQ
jgi:uncharacterized membrane protein